MKGFVSGLPKVELHVHIEGTLEPELMFTLAKRNGIALSYDSVEAVKLAYEFDDLQSFLDLYYQGAQVLKTEQDFYDLTYAYLLRCKEEHVIHTEIFFDPQTHTQSGVSFDTVIKGIDRALIDGQEKLGISSQLIMCFLRHLSEDAAIETLRQALPYKDKIIAVGLDSSEQGHPPEKFQRVFKMAREVGFLTVAHAGEEGPANNIVKAIELLHVSRVDHGVRCTEDAQLVRQLIQSKMPLTVCPLSNTKLKVFADMSEHNIVQLLEQGVRVTINSDDPAYFGGYMNANFMAIATTFNLSKQTVAQFTEHAIEASFISDTEKSVLHERLQHYLAIQFKPVI
ncbi:adenosine deaminase [Photobacterium minamisatsumaniensis]|uniref:adenosine deaminase n=1 Tax=Photobacterium minamisatsumaniensis TaxID=2910233 RepID=UPI003D101C17